MNLFAITFVSTLLLVISPMCYSYKVLVVSPTPIISHIILNQALVKILLEAGYEVTHITVMRNRKFHPNLKQIFISPKDISEKRGEYKSANAKTDNETPQEFVSQQFSAILQHTSANRLLWNTTQTFDLIIAEWLYSGIFTGLAALYDCPFIWFGTTEPHLLRLRLVDNHISPVPNNEDNDRKPFAKIFEPLLAMRGKPLQSYDQMRSIASLVLVNSHGNPGQGPGWPKRFIPIAGFHVESNTQPLHKSLKRIMDNAKQGVIYLSLGTNMDSKDLTKEIRNKLLKMFGGLKQIVLWQQETQPLYLPNNVHILKWSPQQNILSHPNCVLFITHGGGLSTIEALHFGVPMIGIPVYGDQFSNVYNVVVKGVAKRVAVSYSMVDDIQTAILEMLSNNSYRRKAKQLSTVYRRRAVTAKEDLIYWVNHTILSNNFSHSDPMKPLFNIYITFKIYISKGPLNVGIITLSVLILIPLSFKFLVLLDEKLKKTKIVIK